eukprot:5920958-Pyramimonas_sp.AAC.1
MHRRCGAVLRCHLRTRFMNGSTASQVFGLPSLQFQVAADMDNPPVFIGARCSSMSTASWVFGIPYSKTQDAMNMDVIILPVLMMMMVNEAN